MSENAPKPSKPFGELDNKSLESDDVETKTADEAPAEVPAEPAEEATHSRVTVPVKMLHHGHFDGEQLIPGHQYELPRDVAEPLIAGKRAVRL